uniref:hypothetical protein n=1 Tax=Escherichia coli TaxID=562 RepID=UPI001A7E17D0
SIKNDGHYFCRAGGNRPDGLNEPVTFTIRSTLPFVLALRGRHARGVTNGAIVIHTQLLKSDPGGNLLS